MKKLSDGWASVLLVVCCLFWGLSFPLMPLVKSGMKSLETGVGESGLGATVNAWRFLAAGVLLIIPVLLARRHFTATEIRGGSALGLTFGCGMFLQILGLAWIVPSVSGMITAMPVLLAPIAQAFILRRAVGGKTWIAAGIAIVGCLVLTLGPIENTTTGSLMVRGPFPFAGELATFGSAICFTAHLLLIDRFGPRCGATQLTTVMFIVVGLGNLVAAFGFGASPLHTSAALESLFHQPTWLWAMISLIIICSIAAMWLMNRAQPSLSPARAAVLYTMEPLFALVFSLLLGQERLTTKTVLGSALILGAAVFVSQDWHFFRRREPREA